MSIAKSAFLLLYENHDINLFEPNYEVFYILEFYIINCLSEAHLYMKYSYRV